MKQKANIIGKERRDQSHEREAVEHVGRAWESGVPESKLDRRVTDQPLVERSVHSVEERWHLDVGMVAHAPREKHFNEDGDDLVQTTRPEGRVEG